MAKDQPSENPYAPPASPAKLPVAVLAEPDEINDMLQRAFFAATYGTIFLPYLGYLVALFFLIKARKRRDEFSSVHQKLYKTTVTICWVLLIPMSVLAAIALIALFVSPTFNASFLIGFA